MPTTEDVIAAIWAAIDARDWKSLGELLDPAVVVRWPHTGEVFSGADKFVGVQRDYPGLWRVQVDEIVAVGERGASRVTVTDGAEIHHVASFFTVRSGVAVDGVEYWVELIDIPAERRATPE